MKKKWLSKLNFYVKNYLNLIFLTKQYHFRSTFLWLIFFTLYFLKWCRFLTTRHYFNSHSTINSLEDVIFLPKVYLIFYPFLRNLKAHLPYWSHLLFRSEFFKNSDDALSFDKYLEWQQRWLYRRIYKTDLKFWASLGSWPTVRAAVT